MPREAVSGHNYSTLLHIHLTLWVPQGETDQLDGFDR
jgi:hypothetical protein